MSEQTKVRMLLVESDRAVCVGGRWDGWLFWLHPNGGWVSARKLPETEPIFVDSVFSESSTG
jgi:hypothetical protein